MGNVGIDQYGDIFDSSTATRTLDEFSVDQGIEFLSLPKIVQDEKNQLLVLCIKKMQCILNQMVFSYTLPVSQINYLHSVGRIR